MEIRMALDGTALNECNKTSTTYSESNFTIVVYYIVAMDLQACTWQNYTISQSGFCKKINIIKFVKLLYIIVPT